MARTAMVFHAVRPFAGMRSLAQRHAALLLLALWLVATLLLAARLRANPPGAHSAGGPVLGIETLITDRPTVRWEGPFGREATLQGAGRVETWRHPYFTGSPELRGTYVVDRTIGWGEAILAAWAEHPLVHGAALVAIAGAIAFRGTRVDATLLALILRVPRALSPAWFLDSDPGRYHRSAVELLAGKLPSPTWPPGWPATLAGVYGIFGADPAVGRLTGAVLGAAFVPVVASLARRPRCASEPDTRVLTALLCAVSFELVAFAPSLFSEVLFLPISALFLRFRRPELRGLLAAFGGLVRAPMLAVAPTTMLMARPTPPAIARWAAGFVLPLLVWVSVSTAYSQPSFLAVDVTARNLWIGHGPGATGDWREPGAEPPEGWLVASVGAMAADPARTVLQVGSNIVRLWSPNTSDRTIATRPLPLPLLPFGGLVLLAIAGLPRWRPAQIIGWLAATTVVTAAFFVVVRYKLALYPALLPLAAAGLARLFGFVRSRARCIEGS